MYPNHILEYQENFISIKMVIKIEDIIGCS